MDPPKQWPKQVVDEYEPVRTLGKGGFASVVLAKRKNPDPGEKNDQLVAIKVVDASTGAHLGYAHREKYILQELSHPRIMRLVQYWEPPSSSAHDSPTSAVLALSYAKGPTLDLILRKGGAPNLVFCRVVMSQLVDAVAYLHSHAVLHRDIKPDNLVVSAALKDEIWDDMETESPDFGKLRKKWHVTLVDFGFARALSRDEVQHGGGFRNSVVGKPSEVKISHSRADSSDMNEAMDMSSSMHFDESVHSSGSSRSGRKLDRSHSKVVVRKMSALGNRNYAAPEVINGVKKEAVNKNGHTLSTYVSDYGMVADAFSVGATIRYTLSGVPPDQNIEETIAARNSPMGKAARWLGKKMKKKDTPKKYRSGDQFPSEVTRLVKGLTHWNPKERTTVRTARLYPWVDDALEDTGQWKRREVEYLKCASVNYFEQEKPDK